MTDRADGLESLYGGMDLTRTMFGVHARSVPAWWWVQDQGFDGGPIVTIAGGSRMAGLAAEHPARYGSARSHLLMVGELILRPQLIVATDARRGSGLPGLVMRPWEVGRLSGDDRQGEVLLGSVEAVDRLLRT
jgi:hypothetical protein